MRGERSTEEPAGRRTDPRAALEAAEREIAELREQLSLEMAERGGLLSVVSHELGTPITVIKGYNNLLLSGDAGPLNERQRTFLAESNRSCERLNRFVADLLSACRPGTALSLDPCASLESLVAGLASFFRPLLDERKLELEIDLAPDALWGRFDAARIEQVLTNLVSNAIRYSKPNAGHTPG